MRLSDTEFGKLTPALFELLLKRKEARDKQEFLCAGIVAAAVVNSGMCRPEKMVSPLEFVPGRKDEGKTDLSKMTPEEQARYVKNQFTKRRR